MYAKIFECILSSSVWCGQPLHVRVAWVALLALADKDGYVYGTVRALAQRADLPMDQMQAALDVFQAPDAESTTPPMDRARGSCCSLPSSAATQERAGSTLARVLPVPIHLTGAMTIAHTCNQAGLDPPQAPEEVST